jgi:hypothetical protein
MEEAIVKRLIASVCLMSITLTASASTETRCRDLVSSPSEVNFNKTSTQDPLVNFEKSRVRVSINERAEVKSLIPLVMTLLDKVDKLIGFMKPTQTYLELSGILGLRDSYVKHINFEIMIGLYNISQLTTAVKAVVTHEYSHASLYEYVKAKNPSLDINSIRPLLRPYNELYADLVTALLFDDPKIMFTSLEHGNKKSAEDGISRTRDFSIDLKFKDWTESIVGESIWDPYIQLDPVRGKIWEYIKSKKLSKKKYPILLKAFVETTLDHVLERMERGESEERQHDPGVVNKEFFTKLVSNLKLQSL